MAEKKILDNQVDLSAYDTAAQAAQKVAAAVETGDEQTLAAAKSYADTQDAATLASAKEYTAEEIGKLNFVKFVETLPQTGESKYIYAVVQEERTPDDEAIVLLFVWTGTEWAASGVMAGAVDASVFQPYIDACQAAQTAAQTAQTGAESARDAAEEAKDAAVSAQTAAESAQSAAETAKGQAETFASSAQTSATAAETSAGSADTFAQAALSSQQAAAGSATAASASADLAQAWAVKTDGAVADGEYSAKYHAQQAAASATAADGFASTATTQATNAAGSAELAQKWATQMDSEVAEGQGYGAQKYAQDAASSASGAAASATAAAAAADQAADKAQTDLSNVSQLPQSRINAIMPANMDYVVESYTDAETGQWYRVYKSGWIEQGGGPVSYGGGWGQRGTVNLLKEMADQKYMVILTFATTTSFAPSLACTGRNVTSFSWQKDANDSGSYGGNFVWMVIGQGA